MDEGVDHRAREPAFALGLVGILSDQGTRSRTAVRVAWAMGGSPSPSGLCASRGAEGLQQAVVAGAWRTQHSRDVCTARVDASRCPE